MKAIKLPFNVKKPILACGADMKGAFAIAKGDTAYLVEGFGDLADFDNLKNYEGAVAKCVRETGISPKAIVCDHHPSYLSTRFGEMYGLEHLISDLVDVQHHEAHVASALIDAGMRGRCIGVAFDGTGFGWDGCVWGGEFFVGDPKSFSRAAHLEYVPMPGGDAAVREPWRMAATHLYGTYGDEFLRLGIDLIKKIDRAKWRVVKKMISSGVNAPLTSSAGRLFDAVASIVLSKQRARFEAELPIELEKMAAEGVDDSYGFDIRSEKGVLLVGYRKLIEAISEDIEKGTGRAAVSAKFHNTMAQMIAQVASRIRKKTGIRVVALSGGVFQNKYLSRKAVELLRNRGFMVITHSRVNTNDSGIPIGQIAVAHARGICA